ncbi:MAG: thermonuclease family protein [Candidatus Gastranaerophilales bacterium]|nr:thermonuclease family protein [Candidatus Gastranaerophilales bacterium]
MNYNIKMKCILYIILLFLSLFFSTAYADTETYKVIKVTDGDTIYVDFNGDGFTQKEEKVRLNGIDTFETKINSNLYYQMKNYDLTENEVLGLGFYGKEFAKKELLNKYVVVKYTAKNKYDKNNRKLMSVYYDCKDNFCKCYEEEVLKQGYAVVFSKSNIAGELKKYEDISKIKYYAKQTHNLNLVILNKNTNKYHKPNCKKAQNLSNSELIEKPKFKFQEAKCCHNKE